MSHLASELHFEHPWRDMFNMFGISAADFVADDAQEFATKFGHSCGSVLEADQAWQWIWQHCRYLRAKLVAGSPNCKPNRFTFSPNPAKP